MGENCQGPKYELAFGGFKSRIFREESEPFDVKSFVTCALHNTGRYYLSIKNRNPENRVMSKKPLIDKANISFFGFAPLLFSSINWDASLIVRDIMVFASQNIDRYCTECWYDPKKSYSHDSFLIKVIPDRKAQTLTIADNGQGLLEEELNNLSNKIVSNAIDRLNIASSEVFDLKSGKYSLGLLGLYVIAYKITIITKHEGHMNLTWDSSECGQFTVQRHKKKLIERGNRICLHLKKSCLDLLKRGMIKKIVDHYCKNIMYPIKVIIEKLAITGIDDSTKIMDIGDVISNAYGYKKKQTYIEDIQLNEVLPLWNINSYSITMEEYSSLYKSLTSDFEDFIFFKHLSIAGTVTLNAILFIPLTPPADKFNPEDNKYNIKLYSNNNFIMYNNGHLLPEYFNFIKGVVDCKRFPEHATSLMLTDENHLMKTISKVLTQQVYEMLVELKDERDTYEDFYVRYSTYLKVAIMENKDLQEGLKSLLMFKTSKSDGKLSFLDEIANRMEDSIQDFFYYICGNNLKECESSPFIEYFKEIEFEVIYMGDPFDSYMITLVEHFKNIAFVACNLEHLPLPISRQKKNQYERDCKKYKHFCKKVQDILEPYVSKVMVSKRLVVAPFCVATEENSCIPVMEQVNSSLSLTSELFWKICPKKSRVLEINAYCLLIRALAKKNPPVMPPDIFEATIHVLYGAALMASGFQKPHDVQLYAGLIYNFIERAFDLPIMNYNKKCLPNVEAPVVTEFDPSCGGPREQIPRCCLVIDALE